MLKEKRQEQVIKMIEALVGMLRNVRQASSEDVELYLRNHEQLTFKLTNTEPSSVSPAVAQKHFETIQVISKHFTDPQNENFRECSPYVPFLAWVTQFYFLTTHVQTMNNVEAQRNAVAKELEKLVDKQLQVEGIYKTFEDEDYAAFYAKEIEQD
mmetsp:Transcript_29967/g.22237  ORF Transcript_29967/g.22237 Transcript_29967/m.22237 type:complete len:155 (-) Transcript_29967:191-655(-)